MNNANKKRIILIIIVVIILCLGIFSLFLSLSKNKSSKQKTDVIEDCSINTRQEQILKDNNLPTTCSQLSNSQKEAIKRIEELLNYLEKKYSTSFNYVGYHAPETLEKAEWLEATSEKLYDGQTIEVSTTDKNYSDNYYATLAANVANENLEKKLSSILKNKIKIFSGDDNRYFSEEEPKSIKDLQNVTQINTSTIFVKNKNTSDPELRKIANIVGDWNKKEKIYGYYNIIKVDEDYFNNLTYLNYESAKIENNTEISLSVNISETGNIEIK